MDRDEALRLLREQIERIEQLKHPPALHSQYEIWEDTTKKVLRILFDEGYVRMFDKIRQDQFARNDAHHYRLFLDVLERKKQLLQGFIKEYERLKTKGIMESASQALIRRKYTRELLVAFKKLCVAGSGYAAKQQLAPGVAIVANADIKKVTLDTGGDSLKGELADAFHEMIEKGWIEEERSLDDRSKGNFYFDYKDIILKLHTTYDSVWERQKQFLEKQTWPLGDHWFRLTAKGEVLAENSPETSGPIIASESYFSKGDEYEAKKKIVKIMKSARNSLDIQDNYLNEEIFDLIGDLDPKLKIRLLCAKPTGNFKFLYEGFHTQHPNVEAKMNNACHDRFVIIDKSEIWHLGPSIKNAGERAGMINRVETESEKQKILSDFDKWWDQGTVL